MVLLPHRYNCSSPISSSWTYFFYFVYFLSLLFDAPFSLFHSATYVSPLAVFKTCPSLPYLCVSIQIPLSPSLSLSLALSWRHKWVKALKGKNMNTPKKWVLLMRRHEVVVHLGSTGNNNKLNFLFRPWLLFIMMVKFWKKKICR